MKTTHMKDDSKNTQCYIFNEVYPAFSGTIIHCCKLMRCINSLISYIRNKKCCNEEYKLTVYDDESFIVENCSNKIILNCRNQVGIRGYLLMLSNIFDYCGDKRRYDNFLNDELYENCPGLKYVEQNYLNYTDYDKYEINFSQNLRKEVCGLETIPFVDMDRYKKYKLMVKEEEEKQKLGFRKKVLYTTECISKNYLNIFNQNEKNKIISNNRIKASGAPIVSSQKMVDTKSIFNAESFDSKRNSENNTNSVNINSSLIKNPKHNNNTTSIFNSIIISYLQQKETQFSTFFNNYLKTSSQQNYENNFNNKHEFNHFDIINIVSIMTYNNISEENNKVNFHNTQTFGLNNKFFVSDINNSNYKNITLKNNLIDNSYIINLDKNSTEFYLIYEYLNKDKLLKKKVMKIESLGECCEKNEVIKISLLLGKSSKNIEDSIYIINNDKKMKASDSSKSNFLELKNKNTSKIETLNPIEFYSKISNNLNTEKINIFDSKEQNESKVLEEKCKVLYNSKKLDSYYFDTKIPCKFSNNNLQIEGNETYFVSYYFAVIFIFIGIICCLLLNRCYKFIKHLSGNNIKSKNGKYDVVVRYK
ncbi:hypothetical protein NAPIS_ORF01807 [Vairimorpha apis BRL 01]|uniref:Uncharacterized protein n=1 Tax=Vairimorpha apis BRL 01 TaxID=1037528 RepID=T0L832_9MICR|nr:hypothetical protein NAPIS_ORF01807 [Vairimorpha apis BRL 01]